MKGILILPCICTLFLILSCKKNNDIPADISVEKVSGYVQKGPFLNGTSISVYELTDHLEPTGKNFPSQILDNKGMFEIRIGNLSSQFVLLKADGYYFNEITNENSTGQLTLYALSDIANKSDLNVNVLSTLEKKRVEYLVSYGKSFTEAKDMALAEILGIFEMSMADLPGSEELDISRPGNNNAILLAISTILQAELGVAELSELIANISSDIQEDGILDDPELGKTLIFNAHKLHAEQIKNNLQNRYEGLNLDVILPDFEKYLNQFIENTEFEFNALPEVETNVEFGDITANSVIGGGNILKEGISAVSERGVCWSKEHNPGIGDNKTIDGSGIGAFSSNIYGLLPNTTYYVRAYATNGAGTAYGSEVSFTTKESGIGTVTDIDGNIYHTVIIGSQVWMLENLRTTKYRNGESIENITDKTAWQNTFYGGYCWYNNDISNKETYGALYNWFAVSDSRNIAPEGWHVPDADEWNELIDFLGGDRIAGGKLKENGTLHWKEPNIGATNESGFCALPAGMENGTDFYDLGISTYFWGTDEGEMPETAWGMMLYFARSDVQQGPYGNKTQAQSVRCIKD